MNKKIIAIAGASGFVGTEVLKALLEKSRADIEVKCLSRIQRQDSNPNINWVKCDLYSLLDIEKALENVEVAYYLVHSMSPTASLDQGEFQDYDLILADNFARSAKRAGVKQIIYLGGIIPDRRDVSMHLRSSYEVERTLRAYDVKVTAIRTGFIVGREGSSFNILLRLVNRLPFIICPNWMSSKTQPIDLDNVVSSLIYCLDHIETLDRSFDIGGPTILTYREMLEEVSKSLGKSRIFLSIPFFLSKLSKYCISKVTSAPSDLVYHLISSLKHSVVVDPQNELVIPNEKKISFYQSLNKAIEGEKKLQKPQSFYLTSEIADKKEVRSVCRLILPQGKRAQDVAFDYFVWLPTFFKHFIKVKVAEEINTFYLFGIAKPLLILERSVSRSTIDRQLYYITGGLLSKNMKRGRLEFREVLGGKYIIAAIHEYRPSLPWQFYRFTQAPLHLFVMKSFNKWLKEIEF